MTMKPLREMTNQEIFDTVATHLLRQNARSMGPRTDPRFGTLSRGCAYRGDGGLRCAIG